MIEPPNTAAQRRDRVVASLTAAAVLCLAVTVVEGNDGEPYYSERRSEGITRVDFVEIGASIAVPPDWYVSFSKGKLMGSFVATEIACDGQQSPPARFTVNAVSNLMKARFRRVSEQVDEFTQSLSQSSEPQLLDSRAVRLDGYVGRGLDLRARTADGAVQREHRLYLAHDTRDWLVIVSFTAGESDWERLASARAVLLEGLVLN